MTSIGNKANEFIASTQFKSKLNFQKNNLHLLLQKDFLNELSSLADDTYNDIDIHIIDGNVHLRHRCIVSAICPLLLTNNVNINELLNEPISLEKFPDNIQQHEKKILRHIYCSTEKNVLDEINTEINFMSLLNSSSFFDVTFKVHEIEFKCHKCIMASRCEYFSKMFSGNWKEDNLDVIELKDISTDTFKFILAYIYSNAIDIPAEVDLIELLYIADMYNIKSIKQAVLFHMKAHLCYFFIAPCEMSIPGVLKSLEVSQMFSLCELSKDCFEWFIKHYGKIFSSRTYSKCSPQLKNNIKEKIKENVSNETVIRHLKDCNKLKSCLPNVKWAQSMMTLIEELEEFCLEFICNNFESVTNVPAFQYCLLNDKDVNSALMLEELLITAISKYISKENCIDIYKSTMIMLRIANRFDTDAFNGYPNKMEAVNNCKKFIVAIQDECKKFVGKNIFLIQKMKKWKSLRKEIKEQLMSASVFISIENDDNT